ncbi:MAG TPA: hypothetical protein VFV43_09160 [Limnobacter sp.]|nr:hypothetical protein [Limnobacter sp.]
MTLDKRARETAFRLVRKLGKDVTYTRVIQTPEPVYNEATGLFESTVEVSGTVRVEPPSSPKPEQLREGQITAADLIFILPAKGLPATLAAMDTPGNDPQPNDKVAIDGVTWTVKFVTVQYSGLQKAYWDLVVGR